MSDISIDRQDSLKRFSLSYMPHRKKFYGCAEIIDGEFVVSMETGYYDTPEEALEALKQLLIKAYVKRDAN